MGAKALIKFICRWLGIIFISGSLVYNYHTPESFESIFGLLLGTTFLFIDFMIDKKEVKK